MKLLYRISLLTAGALLVSGCARPEAPTAEEVIAMASPAESAHAHHGGEPMTADAPMTGMSIYHLDSRWTDQHGAARQLGDLRGRPQVIAMVYTNCGSACPLIVGDMKRLEATFPDLGMVLVSIDPERDTPGRLLEFATGSQLSQRWTLLNGGEDQLMELAAVLGVRYRRVTENDFMHSNVITVLDASGEIVYRQEALGEIDGTIAALRRLAAS
jgi:protein SCO1/2